MKNWAVPWDLNEYITVTGKVLMFKVGDARYFGTITVGFDRSFGATSSWEICDWKVKTKTRTENAGGTSRGVVCDGIENTSRALLTPGRALEQVKFK